LTNPDPVPDPDIWFDESAAQINLSTKKAAWNWSETSSAPESGAVGIVYGGTGTQYNNVRKRTKFEIFQQNC
jgi:hypothetical protein